MPPQDTGRQLWRNPGIVSLRQFRDDEAGIQQGGRALWWIRKGKKRRLILSSHFRRKVFSVYLFLRSVMTGVFNKRWSAAVVGRVCSAYSSNNNYCNSRQMSSLNFGYFVYSKPKIPSVWSPELAVWKTIDLFFKNWFLSKEIWVRPLEESGERYTVVFA